MEAAKLKLVVFGASGSGTTTLAKSLSQRVNAMHLDADDYYWEKTEIPFQQKVEKAMRNHNLKSDFEESESAIVSGSLVTWGDYWNDVFDLAIFLKISQKVRMNRLRQREIERHGEELNSNIEIKRKSEEFLAWAERYDDEFFEGRSIKQHLNWMKSLACECLIINGDISNEDRIALVLEKLNRAC